MLIRRAPAGSAHARIGSEWWTRRGTDPTTRSVGGRALPLGSAPPVGFSRFRGARERREGGGKLVLDTIC
jgi:hypothetical protein